MPGTPAGDHSRTCLAPPRPGAGPAQLPDPRAARWFPRRTWQPAPWSAQELVATKAGRRVSVVLPALNEEATVGEVVAAIAVHGPDSTPRRGVPLVDEIVVMDGGSRDGTASRAAAAGALVLAQESVLSDLPVRPGKGEVLWRSLAATSGDLVVFVDADLVDVDPAIIPGLLGPLLTVPDLQLVKGFYHRGDPDRPDPNGSGGGRVTEVMARPLLARFAPELSGLVQPLGGEYAATRTLLESLPFAGGYGVEIGLLLDTVATVGLDAIGQVDLGVRLHRHRDLLELGAMAQQVLATVLSRVGVDLEPVPVNLVQFTADMTAADPSWRPVARAIGVGDRPPMADLLAARP